MRVECAKFRGHDERVHRCEYFCLWGAIIEAGEMAMEEEEDLGGCCDGSCREEGARQIALVVIGWWAAHTSRPRLLARIGWGRRGRAEHSCRSFGLPEARVRGRDERRWMICRHGESALQSPNALSSSSDIRPPASPLPRSRQPFRSPPSFFCLRLPLSRVESRLPLFLFVLRDHLL